MRFAMILMCLPAMAVAQELPVFETLETRYGVLSTGPTIAEWGDAEELLLDGRAVAGLMDRFVDLRAVLPRPDGDVGDWALVSLANGGNGCPMMWAFVRIDAEGAAATAPFGTCSESVMNARTTEEGFVALDMPGWLPEQDFVTYTYDGQAVTEVVTLRTNDGAVAAGAGADVTRWIASHPTVPFADAGERLRFASIMSEAQVYELAARVEVGSEVVEIDGYVVGQGFDPAAGGDITAMWGIRISDGMPFAVFRDTGLAPLGFVADEDALPQFAEDYMAGR